MRLGGTVTENETGKRTSGGLFWLAALLTFLWFAANSSLAIEALVTGILISAALAFVFTRGSSVWQDIRFSPMRLFHFAAYTGVFLTELVRSNINMMRYVYSPRIRIRPGIVRINTKLKSPIGRLALANSIALTPGSLVVDIEGDSLFVHWLDVKTEDPEVATREISAAFEEHLEKCFG